MIGQRQFGVDLVRCPADVCHQIVDKPVAKISFAADARRHAAAPVRTESEAVAVSCSARLCSKAGMDESVTGVASPSMSLRVLAARTLHAVPFSSVRGSSAERPGDTAAAGGNVGAQELDGHKITIVHPDHPSQ